MTVFSTALAARLLVVFWAWGRFPATADGVYYHRLAQRLADGAGYTWLWPDGAVTHAAHYPVGYPALLAPLYAVAGSRPELAMLLAALLGAAGALAIQRVVAASGFGRASLLAGLLVALHPTLVMYTAALMTEAVTASLLGCAAWVVVVARRRQRTGLRARWLLLVGVCVAVCVLVRPQCLLLAPLLGWLCVPARASTRSTSRFFAAGAVTVVTLLAVAPWTVRNCVRMGSCALVSVNGGWNLLIGTQSEGRRAWSPLKTPAACRAVYDEAEKDACFGRAARERIAAAPETWLALAPSKLSATFDHCGAPAWYLHTSNRQAFPPAAVAWLDRLEIVYQRSLVLLSLLAAWPRRPRRARSIAATIGLIAVGLGVLALLTPYGWIAWVALVVSLFVQRGLRRPPALYGLVAGVVGSVALVHVLFFGAGRYAMITFPLLCALAAVGVQRVRGIFAGFQTR